MTHLPQGGYGFDFLTEDEYGTENRVELSGFGGINDTDRQAADRIIESHLKRLSGRCQHMECLRVTMKGVHQGKHQKKVEVRGKLVDNGKSYTSQVIDHNLLAGLDKALQKLENSLAE